MAVRGKATKRAMERFFMLVFIVGVVKSEIPTCSYNFNATHAIISCKTSKMYPKAKCVWTHKGEPLTGLPPTHSESLRGVNSYYSTECSTSLKIESPGMHKVFLDFLPDLLIENQDINTAAITKEIDIEVVPPSLSVYNSGTRKEMTSEIIVKDKQTITLECQSNGGIPAKSKMLLTCPRDRTTSNHIELDYTDIIRLSVAFNNDMDGSQCSCSVQHLSVDSSISKILMIFIVVPPSLSVYNAGTRKEMTSEIIVKDKQTITLECQSNGGIPAKSKMLLTCPRDRTTSNHIELDYTDIIRLSVAFNNDMDGGQCSCSVQHLSVDSSISKILMIFIVETPSKPVIYADKGLVIGSKLIVKEKDWVHLKCESVGGKPKQSDMTIACPYKGLSQYTDTISKYFSFNRSMDGNLCNCSAKHRSSDESLITLLAITIVVVPQTPSCYKAFDEKTANIICTTNKVYPQANCHFMFSEGFKTLMLPIARVSRHSICYYPRQDTVGYYNTTCRTSLAIKSRSNFNIVISMFPDLQLKHDLETFYSFAKVTENVKFEVDSAKIQTFTINKSYAKSETTLTCTALGDPLPTIIISYINPKRESTTISRENAYTLSHKLYPTCSDTGLYRCNVFNMLNVHKETNEFNLKVACKAEYYLSTDTLPSYGVPVNEDFNITLPVRVHPEPKNFSLLQGVSIIHTTKKILFTYTNENFSLGEIRIAMRLSNKKGLGVYSLTVGNPQESTLSFNLTAQGRPLCPTDFVIQNISTNAMTISWRPGFNGGFTQTFSVSSHDPANNLTDSFKVEQTPYDVMVYNMTDLSEGTRYILSVETENSQGKTKCPHVNINGTTYAALPSVTSAFITIIASSLAGFLIVLTLGIIAVILMRTRRCHQPVSLDAAWSSRITIKQQEHTVINQLYNDATTRSIAEENSNLNLGGVSTFKSLNTNSPGNRQFKIESAAKGEIYANVVKLESDAAQNINNSDGVYNNSTSLKVSRNDVKASNISAALKQINGRGQDGIDQSGRTVNPDGLTYVSVVVNPKVRKVQFGEGKEDTVRGPVHYMAIDLAATSEAKSRNDH